MKDTRNGILELSLITSKTFSAYLCLLLPLATLHSSRLLFEHELEEILNKQFSTQLARKSYIEWFFFKAILPVISKSCFLIKEVQVLANNETTALVARNKLNRIRQSAKPLNDRGSPSFLLAI